MALLYKHGGIYFDTDVICLRSVENLCNCLAYQSKTELNDAFLSFEKGHLFPWKAMQYHADHFDPERDPIFYGPKLITEVYKQYLLIKRQQRPPAVEAMPVRTIYLFLFGEGDLLYKKAGINPTLEKELDSASAVHLWRYGKRSLLPGLLKKKSLPSHYD